MKTLTQHTLALLLTCGLAFSAHAQYVTIPDANFRAALQSEFDFNGCFDVNGRMDTTCAGIVNATSLNVFNENIASVEGLQYFDNLEIFNCNSNQLTSLPALPNSLLVLTCFNNQLTSLPALPNTLTELQCPRNQLTSLPALPPSLIYLSCSNNQLMSLPTLPPSLDFLQCFNNQLTSLPALPNTLTRLICNNNELTNLPALSNSLQSLECGNNELTSLPALPNSLLYLYCNNNELTSLPSLPNFLNFLECINNELTSLPALPNSLIRLYCYNNQLTRLPALPNSLVTLQCLNNYLRCMPVLPSGLNFFNALNNPTSCIPNMPMNCPDCQAYPLCNIDQICFNANAFCSGTVFLDLNANGVLDNNESNWNNLVVSAMPGYRNATCAYSGYVLALDTNTINTVTLNNPNPNVFMVVPATHTVTSGNPGIVPGSFDFALQPIPNIYDFEVAVSHGTARPGFDTWANIRVTNAGTVADSPLLTFDFPQGWTVLNTIPTGTVNGNTITWQDTTLGMFQHRNFQVQFNVSALVPIGTHCFYSASVPSVGDITPANNIFVANEMVTGAFDPNDKACNTEHLYPGYGADTELLYTIRFQNTGNDTAFTVVLRDTLSPLLQANTLRLVNASHPRCDLSFMDNARALSFIFPNINLLDSFTNEPLSHGFVQYAIKPQPGLPIGTVIENTADIYFDYNAPIRTNTTVTSVDVVGIQTIEDSGALRVYPNPTGGLLRVEAPQPLGGAAQLLVFDMTGRALLEMPFVGQSAELSLERLAAGVYTLALVKEGRVLFRGMVVRR